MADISRIPGPSGPPEGAGGKKEKTPADTEKFKEMMKIEKVRETDPEEQKKRKRKEEEEEEEEPISEPPSPPVQTPFSTPAVEEGPLSVEKTGIKPSFGASMQSSGPTTPSAAASEESQTPSQTQAQPASPPPTQPAAAPTSGVVAGTAENIAEQTPQEKEEKKLQKQLDAETRSNVKKQEEGQKISAPSKTDHEQISSHKEDKEAFFTEFTKKNVQGQPAAEKKEKEAEEAEFSQNIPPIQPLESGSLEKSKEKKDSSSISGIESAPAAAPSLAAGIEGPTEPLPPYVYLNPQVLDIFERMVGVITVMNDGGIQETTIQLSAPQFSSSIFFGAQIIIQEFSTAPSSYNIQLQGSPQAVGLFQANLDDLMAAFQSGNYNFRVNRLEASLLSTDRHLIRRKEQGEGKNGQGQGKNK